MLVITSTDASSNHSGAARPWEQPRRLQPFSAPNLRGAMESPNRPRPQAVAAPSSLRSRRSSSSDPHATVPRQSSGPTSDPNHLPTRCPPLLLCCISGPQKHSAVRRPEEQL